MQHFQLELGKRGFVVDKDSSKAVVNDGFLKLYEFGILPKEKRKSQKTVTSLLREIRKNKVVR
jgi:hypothetical protein